MSITIRPWRCKVIKRFRLCHGVKISHLHQIDPTCRGGCPRNVYASITCHIHNAGLAVAQLVIRRSLIHIQTPGCAVLHVKVSLSKILTPKLLLMCGWHLAWRLLPSVRVLRWAGDLSRVFPALARDSWDSLQQKPHKRDEAVADNGWMDGSIAPPTGHRESDKHHQIYMTFTASFLHIIHYNMTCKWQWSAPSDGTPVLHARSECLFVTACSFNCYYYYEEQLQRCGKMISFQLPIIRFVKLTVFSPNWHWLKWHKTVYEALHNFLWSLKRSLKFRLSPAKHCYC